MNYRLLLFPVLFLFMQAAHAQGQPLDTVVVQTLTYDSIGRAGVFHFPDSGSYERVIMQYSMRCHHALVSNGTNTEQGCGQWDYNCETYLWDSTRTDSLKYTAPSAIISNYPPNTNFPYTTKPTFSVTRRDEKIVKYPAGTTFLYDSVVESQGSGLTLTQPYERMYFVLPASSPMLKLVNKASPIAGIGLKVISGADTLRDLRIRMHLVKPGSYNSLSIYPDTSFKEVYHATTFLSSNSTTLLFYNPFTWDGTSDIVMEISYSGMSGNTALTLGTVDTSVGITSTPSESALSFAGSEFVPVPVTALNDISNAITIAFWAYGDTSYLPGSNSVFCEGLDPANHRQINIHLPWSDGNVYWDCGGDAAGNFDRIQKAAGKHDAAGRWNYWAFTKDATTGKMAIYLNGALWLSDTGKYRPIHATEMLLGGAASSGIGWFGDVRQFAMFDRALDSSQIVSMMLSDAAIPGLDPITYFKLNEGAGPVLTNSAFGMTSSTLAGIPVWHTILGKDLPNNFDLQNNRPKLALLQLSASATPTITDSYTYDSIPDHAHFVTNYRIGHNYAFHQNDTVVAVDTIYGDYLATKSYTYDETGKKVDSVNVAAQDTIRPTNLYYWTRSPQKYELMSFVTPYGIGLDLGKTGKMWEFDVTDYLPVMRGWKRLTMERGSGQEEFDLRFLFIKGTPVRNVLDMQQLWPMTEESYQTIQSNLRYPPLRVYLDPEAKGYKLRSYITGHGGTPNGLNGEFTPQWHDIFVNQTNYRRFVYKICSLDPLYPQGGTWTLNRAGWCPGMATDLAEYEITGTVTPGDSATIDYNVEGGVGDSRYDPSTQLVSYGPPNFTLDAGIVTIERPSAMIAYGRINPACDAPIVLIRNNGSTALTSLQFEYYVDSGKHLTYTWTGNLAFLDTASVLLPIDSLSFWTSNLSGQFHVDILKPDGGTDQYDQDNHYSSNYTQPPQYNGIVVVNLRTNNHPDENYYEIYDMAGDSIFWNSGFDPTTTYYDSLILPVGCYTLAFHDDFIEGDGENGLYYWADTSQHAGAFLRLRQGTRTGKILYSANNDFGKGVQYDFSIVSSPLAVDATQPEVQHIGLYPNPAQGELNLDLEGMPAGMITLEVSDALGRPLRREQRFTDPLGTLRAGMDLTGMQAGTYFLRITTREGETTKSFVVK
ncbi:MAG TPA: LamG-like jellyroll fold domain-containing protein [Candidatus Kapabacteria bacterium]|nr:LamG-like jellyroll fold domain-containing protein [Candidatus Kapabacteria bacterium]